MRANSLSITEVIPLILLTFMQQEMQKDCPCCEPGGEAEARWSPATDACSEWLSTGSLLYRHQQSQPPRFGWTSNKVLVSAVEAVRRPSGCLHFTSCFALVFGPRRRSSSCEVQRESELSGLQLDTSALGFAFCSENLMCCCPSALCDSILAGKGPGREMSTLIDYYIKVLPAP